MTSAVEVVGAVCGYGEGSALSLERLRIAPGEFVGAVGPSGAGKTTLIRALTGRCEVSGDVRVFGRPVGPGRGHRSVGYVPQVGTIDPSFPITVEEVVLQGLGAESSPLPWASRRDRAAARAVMERLGIAHLARRAVGDVSGGELQRAGLARALARRPALLLLDEPTAGVDLATRHEILHLLGELHGEGTTILLTTHDLNFVAAHLPRIVCLAGRVVADGPPEEVFTPGIIRATYGAEVRIIRDVGMVFVADPTHLLTAGGHHDTPDHPVDPPRPGGRAGAESPR